MYYVGIDWADEAHHVYITDDSGQKLDSFPIDHNTAGMNKLQEHIHKFSRKLDNILFSIETDKCLVVSALIDWGYTVYPINPKSVDRYRDRYKVSGVKSDEFDACVLANILRTDRHRFRPILPDSELARELKVLTRDRDRLVGDRTRLSNRLTSTLKAYYPAALELFCHIDQPITLSFLSKYPTYQDAKSTTFGEFKTFLSENRYPGLKRANEIYERLQQPHLKPEDMIARAKSRLMLAIVSQLQPLIQQIKAYEKEIKRLLDSHPDAHIFRSLPGAGDTLSARFIAEFGDNRDRYQEAVNAQAEAGSAPVTIQSGKMKYVKFRKACKKPFRATVHQFAFCSIKQCSWAREYYDQQVNGGKTHTQAIRSLSNKWMKIIFALWKRHQTYDEEHHLLMKKKHAIVAV
jgi:transposase